MALAPVAGGLAVLLFVGGCGSTTEPVGVPADPVQLANGEELYQASRAECHRTDLRGTDLGPSHLSEVYEPNHHADASFLLAVRRGSPAHHWNFGDMAPIEGLSDDDVAAITAYVRSVQEEQGFEPYPPLSADARSEDGWPIRAFLDGRC